MPFLCGWQRRKGRADGSAFAQGEGYAKRGVTVQDSSFHRYSATFHRFADLDNALGLGMLPRVVLIVLVAEVCVRLIP